MRELEEKLTENDNDSDEEQEVNFVQFILERMNECSLTLSRPQVLRSGTLHCDFRAGACVQILHGAGVHRVPGVHRAATE